MRTQTLAITAAIAALAFGAAAQAKEADRARTGCFASHTWNGWNVSEDGDALYLRVGINDIYRVDLTPGTHARKYPNEFLVNEVRGSNFICSALDLDLEISDHLGFRRPLIAQSLVKLTPAEIAAIPRKRLP